MHCIAQVYFFLEFVQIYPMDEQDLLNFNYPLLPDNQIQAERIIKQQIRDGALNMQVTSEVLRYSDKYLSTISYADVMKSTNKEIMSAEMQKIQGFHYHDNSKVILNDLEDDENQNNSQEENDEEMSLGGGDDYEQNYYDEDDHGDDNDEREEVF